MIETSYDMVSVCMITYNHEKYISQAIEGILMQHTSFPIELVIGEDCSTDQTRKICKWYQEKYPDIIKLLLPENNLGMMPNFLATLKACNGKYIALCEGDDYWSDPLKLQKQIDFLEKNTDYSICFHKMKIIGKTNESNKCYTNSFISDMTMSIEDLAKGNFIFSASCVFRNLRQNDIFRIDESSPVGDYVLFMNCAKFGKIMYLNQTMAVYRIHDGGIWSSKTSVENYTKWIRVIELMRDDFTQDVQILLNKQIITAIRQLIILDNTSLSAEDKRALEKKALDLFPDCFELEIKSNFTLKKTLESHHSIKKLSWMLLMEILDRFGIKRNSQNQQK
ncbi:MAG: hypothetical protein A2W93_10770 [Bacteroidetes bacterium GWF2_43_63]|nr:MAG: hypothetical protein A2W94_01690 [Bacteroidetes bacterium GWE2_42_42]OFY52996.1 MAG: hypothetical protein A2W93_10770 [Bacteroidetes bacterium GWF2_43_63]HCB62179.1 hypothetical protein [Bacteroidales bacterium]